ncbi:MAG: glycosyltransferase family 4 protein [Anaerolineae bacterium]
MRIAVVTGRYGPGVIGGAESLARGFAHAISQRGWDVEVWTTCARSHYTWENELPSGSEHDAAVMIRRFPITGWDAGRFGMLDRRLQTTGRLSLDEEFEWLATAPHSVALYHHIREASQEFDVVLCLPYASPVIQSGAWMVKGASLLLWPCLHNEPYAYMEIVRHLLERAEGVMFLSPEEQDLAIGRLGLQLQHSGVVGGGMDVAGAVETLSHASGERGAHVVYAGRLEDGKNLGLLYTCMQQCHRLYPDVQLRVIGSGPLKPPNGPGFEYLGFVSEEQKAELLSSALALCQPSLNESFSITIMESWLSDTPVLVHSDCPVTRGHVLRSRGGLHFRDCQEFTAAVEWFVENPWRAGRMAANGRRYVTSNYSWDAVISRFRSLLGRWRLC